MDITKKILEGIKFLQEAEGFETFSLGARKGIMVSDEAIEAVKAAGYRIVWADTFPSNGNQETGIWMLSR